VEEEVLRKTPEKIEDDDEDTISFFGIKIIHITIYEFSHILRDMDKSY